MQNVTILYLHLYVIFAVTYSHTNSLSPKSKSIIWAKPICKKIDNSYKLTKNFPLKKVRQLPNKKNPVENWKWKIKKRRELNDWENIWIRMIQLCLIPKWNERVWWCYLGRWSWRCGHWGIRASPWGPSILTIHGRSEGSRRSAWRGTQKTHQPWCYFVKSLAWLRYMSEIEYKEQFVLASRCDAENPEGSVGPRSKLDIRSNLF